MHLCRHWIEHQMSSCGSLLANEVLSIDESHDIHELCKSESQESRTMCTRVRRIAYVWIIVTRVTNDVHESQENRLCKSESQESRTMCMRVTILTSYVNQIRVTRVTNDVHESQENRLCKSKSQESRTMCMRVTILTNHVNQSHERCTRESGESPMGWLWLVGSIEL